MNAVRIDLSGGMLGFIVTALFASKHIQDQLVKFPSRALVFAAHYEDLEESDVRVQHLWTALASFSNEDRSRFLRFVTGRRRLPAPLYVCPDKG